MRKCRVLVWAIAAMLATGTTLGEGKEHGAPNAGASERAVPGWIERGFARLERAIERLEAKLSGRGGSMMESCGDMMGGGMMDGGGMTSGGMMGGSRPNERWREPGDKR